MTPQQALEVLKALHDDRTNKRDDYGYSPQDLTQALNIAIEVMEKHIRLQRALQVVDNIDKVVDAVRTALNRDKPEEVKVPYVIPNHTIPIERIEEIIISTAPAPAKLNQIANLIEKYK